jgi:phospholipid-binding lipoprotein MlaA
VKLASLRRVASALLPALALLCGCATVPDGPRARSDPWEPLNRQVFAFNDAVDAALLKPVAHAYLDVVPEMVRTGIANFLGNFVDAWSAVNLLLQAKPQAGLEMWMRVTANTVFGLAGILDPASEMGLERTTVEDLGQTLGRWGLGSGPYVVLPFLGPSDLRDAGALVVDLTVVEPGRVFRTISGRNTAIALQMIDKRASLFGAEKVLEGIALERYTLIRDAYLSRRRSLVYDGEPPEEEEPPAPPDAAPSQ